ncbi:holin [Delftia tsuruhatensis]|jgi:hypothetical protein|uniref:Holin n=1 Tax=Delftia tsuruhatensis TaxID=180282 RepID=A0AAX3SGX4_9BURK|nr:MULTISPECIES: holin [Delftia]MDH0423446.1 holin [Delftia tsuruhatensis]MPT54823.1 holin [Delftia sp.]WFF79270.1 holin [Delftia tsuruhatensis]SFB21856.1 Bacteriophage holin family, superfamily II-like [Delftia tsuruhatensis]
MKTETLDSIGAAGNKVTIAGAGLSGAGYITASEFAAIVGALVALAGVAITWYYKREANRRLVAEHALRQQERQIRIDLMRATRQPVPHDTNMGALEDVD